MADSQAFAHVCVELENETTFSRIEARGTVRLALKSAGLDAKTVSIDQMKVVLERVLPTELESRGIESPKSTCAILAEGLARISTKPSEDTPEDVFSRLGGR